MKHQQSIRDAEQHFLTQHTTEALDGRLIKSKENNKNKQKQKILTTTTAIAAVGILTIAAILPALMQEAYAPSGRRGFMCEFRMNSWEQTAVGAPILGYTQGIIEQVSLNDRMLIHNVVS